MRILFVATKPPWPPRDGGRLVLWLTIKGLTDAGHEITLIVPSYGDDALGHDAISAALRAVSTPHLLSARRRGWGAAMMAAVHRNQSLSVARHHLVPMENAVASVLRNNGLI